jgi:hypothetical protein
VKANSKLLTTLKATAEIFNKQLSDTAALMFIADLADYPDQAVIDSLARCRKELRTFPTISDIVSRIDDGRPGPEEAWAMIPKDEESSIVWTDEMAEAFGVARGLIDEDPVAARMAFKEAYVKRTQDARAARKPARWTVSLGNDKNGREAALREAVSRGRLTAPEAQALLPDLSLPSTDVRALVSSVMNQLEIT